MRPASVPHGRYLDLPGRGRTYIRETGDPANPTLLLLHGLGATSGLNWFACFPALAREFHVVALDHRGHGRGLRSRRPFRLIDCADDAAAVMDVLGIDRYIAVGYSMGGPIAQLTWRRHQEHVAGLVLCATSRNFRGAKRPSVGGLLLYGALAGASTALRAVPGPLRRQVASAGFGRRLRGTPLEEWVRAEVARSHPGMVIEAARAVGAFSSHEWIGGVDVPTAVVITTRDQLVSPARQRKLAESIPDASVYEVESDHSACALAPKLFVPALVRACRDVSRRAALVPVAR